MNADQKKRAKIAIKKWWAADSSKSVLSTGYEISELLQDLVDAPGPEPVARVTGYYAGYLSIATVDGRVLPAGTALYAAPPAPSVPSVPVPDGWKHDCAGIMQNDVELWLDSCPHCGKPKTDSAPTPAEPPAELPTWENGDDPLVGGGLISRGVVDFATVGIWPTKPAPSVPDGWRIVPYTPTVQMLERAAYAVNNRPQPSKYEPSATPAIIFWTAMLNYAPEAPTPAEAPADVARDAEPWKLLLENLVEGLNKTYWSSWQGTAHFDEYLREAISAIERDKQKGQS